eukprot:g18375.t1
MFVMIWWAILWKAMALELTNDEAWVSIDSAGNLEHHRYGEEEQAELPEVETGRMGDLETESRLMRRSSRSSSRSKHARDQVKQARPDILEEVPMAQLRELGEEWRNSLMSNSSGSGDFRWGSGGLTQGAAGPKGEKGIKGKTGLGPKGDQGAQGEKGPVGELGPIQDMKPPPEGLASASAVGALIFFNLVSAGIVYAYNSSRRCATVGAALYAAQTGQMEKKGGGEGKSMEEAPEEGEEGAFEEGNPEEALPEEGAEEAEGEEAQG